MVFQDIDSAWTIDLTKDRDAHIDIFYSHDRVIDEAFLDESFSDALCHLLTSIACCFHLSDNRKLDGAIICHSVCNRRRGIRGTSTCHCKRCSSSTDRRCSAYCGEGKESLKWWVFTVYDNVDLVLWFQAEWTLHRKLQSAVVCHVLKVAHVSRRTACWKQYRH